MQLVHFGAQLFGCFIEIDLVIQVCDMAGFDRFHCNKKGKPVFSLSLNLEFTSRSTGQ